jgi:hypothetical protein
VSEFRDAGLKAESPPEELGSLDVIVGLHHHCAKAIAGIGVVRVGEAGAFVRLRGLNQAAGTMQFNCGIQVVCGIHVPQL